MFGRQSIGRRILFNAFAWTMVLVIVFPLIWMILTANWPDACVPR